MTPAESRFLARLRQRAAALSPELRTALLAAFRALIAQMKPADLARLIERGDIEGALRLALSDDIMQRAFYPVRERIRQGTLQNARIALRHVPIRAAERSIVVAFDPELNPFVREAIAKLSSGAIQYTAGEVRDAFRTAITNGLEAGINPRQVASGLKNVVGLTPHQERIIGNFQRAVRDGDYAKALQYELRDKRFDPTLRRLLREGKTLSPMQLDEMGNAYRRKFVARNAETMARTAALESQRVGQSLAWREAAEQGALGDARVIGVWVATLDDRVRDSHAAMHHAEREIDGRYPNGDSYPGESEPWNCLLPGTRTWAPDTVAVASRIFDGEAITLHTAAGHELSVTPNHPILTRRGWVAAGLLCEGDDVVQSLGPEWALPVDANGEHVPSRVEDVAESLLVADPSRVAREVVIAAHHFHGDARDGDVAVVVSDGNLLPMADAGSVEHPPQHLLVTGLCEPAKLAGAGATLDSLDGVDLPAARVVSLDHLESALLPAHATPLHRLGLALAAQDDAARLERAGDAVASDPLGVREVLEALTGCVPNGEALRVEMLPLEVPLRHEEAGFALPPHRHAGGDNGHANPSDIAVEIASETMRALTGRIAFDRITKIGRAWFTGHVYNLQTERGWYAAEGIITHNCRCTEVFKVVKPTYQLAA